MHVMLLVLILIGTSNEVAKNCIRLEMLGAAS